MSANAWWKGMESTIDVKGIILKALSEGLRGPDRKCKHYPCHFEGQDCTWCYCPFYPCMDRRMGGFMTMSKKTGEPVWSCMQCTWIHKPKAAQMIIEGLRKMVDNFTPRDLQILRFKVWMKIVKCDT